MTEFIDLQLHELAYGGSLVLKATGILAAAWVIAIFLRTRPARLRHLVWSVAFAAVLALPVIAPWMPVLEVDLPHIDRISDQLFADDKAATEVAADLLAAADERAEALVETPVPLAERKPPAEPRAPRRRAAAAYILFIWMAGSSALAILFMHHLARIRKATSAAVARPRIQTQAAEVARELELPRPPRVLVGQVEMPVTWGLTTPTVLLPVDAIEWDRRRLHLVLKHEFAHIRRFDYLPHVMAELSCILYWPNPLIWAARRRLRAEQELACDNLVLRSGTPSHDYAELLLDFARSVQGRTLLPGGLRMAERKHLKFRIQSILDPEVERGAVSMLTLSAVVLAVALPALSAAALRSSPGDDEAAPVVEAAEEASRTESAPGLDGAVESDTTTARKPATAFTRTVEAESGRFVGPMEVHDDERASGGRYVMVSDRKGHDPPEGGPGQVSVHLDLETHGARAVWARVIGDARNDNSFFVSADGGDEFRWDVLDADGRLVKRWTWLPVKDRSGRLLELEPGDHTLTFRNREDGSRLDAVFVTSDPSLVPRGRSPLPPPETSISVAFEAEYPGEIEAPLEIRADDRASGRLFVSVADGYNSRRKPPKDGFARYPFEVPEAGRYVVWARVEAPGDDSDSFWVRANEREWIRWNGVARKDGWSWQLVHDSDGSDEAVLMDLREGVNLLEVAYREDGAKIDRFVVTNNIFADPSTVRLTGSNVRVTFRD